MMMNVNKYLMLFAALSSGCGATEVSVLQWAPGQGRPPLPAVEVQWLKDNDYLSSEKKGLGRMQPFSAVMDTFCGTNQQLRAEFSDWVSDYAFPKFYYHPAHPKPDKFNMVVTAYNTPYECYQEKFIDWMKTKRGRDDFLIPNARKTNPFKGDLAYPVVYSRIGMTDELLQKTYGYAVLAEPDKITFIGDNRVNPYRWITPINEIHHREQPSWAMRLHSSPEGWAKTAEILQENRTEKKTGRRVLLRYEISVDVIDGRNDLGEFALQDYLQRGETGLISQMRTNLIKYGIDREASQGEVFEFMQGKMVEKFLKTRFDPVNFQLAVGVNFKERDNRYRLAEFMLCSYNHQSCVVFPEKEGGQGVLPTANAGFNKYVRDGGNAGKSAWWRVPISALDDAALTQGGASAWKSEDPYLEMEKPELRRRVFKGEIDVTEFYRQALASKVFPGQRGYWVSQWVGFEGDDPEQFNPDERHGVEWAFFIFENHGPLKVEAEVRQLDVVIVE
jgi:hypothetical protein